MISILFLRKSLSSNEIVAVLLSYALRAESATKIRKVLLFLVETNIVCKFNLTKLVIDLVIDTGHPLRSEFVLPDHCRFGGVVLFLPCT